MFAKFIKNIYEKFTTTNKPKIIPKNIETLQTTNDDSPLSEENSSSHRFGLINGRSQKGNLITYRTRATSSIIYPEQEAGKNLGHKYEIWVYDSNGNRVVKHE